MPKYRKKPVEIEAAQFIGIDADYKPMFATPEPGWLKKALELPHDADGAAFVFTQQSHAPYLVVNTIEGAMSATHGYWIIRGVKGELYPCQPEIFEATYDVIGETVEDHIDKGDFDAAMLASDHLEGSHHAHVDFHSSLRYAINYHSMEREGGDTPDFILANALGAFLSVLGNAIEARDNWKNGVAGFDGPDVEYHPEHAVTIGYAGQDGHSYAPLGDSDGDDGA